MSEFQNKFDKAIWKVVSGIRKGQLMSYGQVARIAGFPRHARMVSKAMSRSTESLPWFRVIRSNHTLAFTEGSAAYKKQRDLLANEGVQIIDGKVVPVVFDEAKELDEILWAPTED